MKMAIQIGFVFLLFSLNGSIHAQLINPRMFESPTVSGTQVAFSLAGDIWVVPRQGGEARRLTTNPARETYPVFSPDGSQIAFTRFNPAGGPFSWDVFTIAVAGGEERRLTYHPDLDFPINWTPDGTSVLFLSFRQRTSLLGGRLYTVPAAGGFPAEVPVPRGWAGSFSPNGDRIAYAPLINSIDAMGWRNYRGGGTSRIWLTRLSDGSVEIIPRQNSNDIYPMWIGDKVYFVSDRDGTENLFVYDPSRKTVLQLTQFEKYGIKSAAANKDSIVFAQGGAIHLFDLKTNQPITLDVRIAGEFPEVSPRKIDTTQWLSAIGLSSDASRLLLGIRGEIFIANTADGNVENITQSPAFAERNPVWSPDGKWIAYFSDESGEQQLVLRPVAGGAPRRVRIEPKPSFYNELQWSPDSKKLVFSDSHLALWFFDLETNATVKLDATRYTDGETAFQPAWSPDSRWLAYSKYGINRLASITLYSFETGKSYPVTSPHIDAQAPLFDLNGKYLYFIGSNRTGLVESQAMSGFPFRGQVTRNLYAVVLNRDDFSPLVELKSPDAQPSQHAIEVENIGDRVLLMPFWPQNASRIIAGKPGVLFIVEGGTLHKFTAGKGVEKFVEGAGNYRITSDGSRLLLRRQGNWSVVSTDTPPKSEEGRLKLNPIELTIDPRSEWKQIYGEAWRRMREYFYDPNLHGQNFAALKDHYAAYLSNITTREELNSLLKEMFSHLSTSHMGVTGGDAGSARGEDSDNVGLLGADFEVADGRYRIKRVLRGDNIRRIISPLARPGLNIKSGEYLLAVDGEEILSNQSLYRYFMKKASKTVKLKVGPSADGSGARIVSVVPIPSEVPLRQYDWAESNRLQVEKASGGKLAYIYLPDTADAGFNAFNHEFYAQLDKAGLIVDGRFNEGGRAADYIIDTLRRIPLQRATLRDAEDIRIPTGIIEGPKVLLTNEMAGSGGDSLPWMWQRAQLGPVVGTRTNGAGIGATTHQLIDRGSLRVPDWGWYDPRSGTWLMENRGVTPDYELEIMPADWRAGRDPQLEKAIQLALEALKKVKVV
ncbi:MAG TPA: PDZ domain-containing protein, partial [Pyrinomonadaceae bacterium]|nr:PDZ domain-containing protein [Pyrinomonadaceae bacterium]